MTEGLRVVDREKAAWFQRVVMVALQVNLAALEDDLHSGHELVNGVTNALIAIVKSCPDDVARVQMIGHSVRLLLDHAGCRSSDILDEVDRVRPLAAFVESEAMGRA